MQAASAPDHCDFQRGNVRVNDLRRVCVTLLLAALTAVLLPASAHAAAGDLDTTFGTGGAGYTLTDIGPYNMSAEGAKGMARTPDGGYVVAGTGSDAGGGKLTWVARYTADGVLVSSFGNAGIVTIPAYTFGVTTTFWAQAVAVDGDGDIYLGGDVNDSATLAASFGIIKLSARGVIDTAFGADGLETQAIGSPLGDDTTAIAFDPTTNQIFLAGSAMSGPATYNLALAAFSATTGAIAASFNTTGYVVDTNPALVSNNSSQVYGLAVDGTNLVVAGSTDSGKAVVARYTNTGDYDTTFNGGNPQTFDLGPGVPGVSVADSVAIGPNDSIVVAGSGTALGAKTCLAVGRLTSDGSVDTTFGSGTGYAQNCLGSGINEAHSVAEVSGGPIYAAGELFDDAQQVNKLALARFTKDGVLDTTFGPAGSGAVLLAAPAGTNDTYGNAVVVDPTTDAPVVAGLAADTTNPPHGRLNFLIARFAAAGSGGSGTSGGGGTSSGGGVATPPKASVSVGRFQNVTTSSGDVLADVDPAGGAVQKCYVQYGSSDYWSSDMSTPCAANAQGAAGKPYTATASLSQLANDSNVFFRFVVVIDNVAFAGPGQGFTTLRGAPYIVNGAEIPGPPSSVANPIVGEALRGVAGDFRGLYDEIGYKWLSCAHGRVDSSCRAVRQQLMDNTSRDAWEDFYTLQKSDAGRYIILEGYVTWSGIAPSAFSKPVGPVHPVPGGVVPTKRNPFAKPTPVYGSGGPSGPTGGISDGGNVPAPGGSLGGGIQPPASPNNKPTNGGSTHNCRKGQVDYVFGCGPPPRAADGALTSLSRATNLSARELVARATKKHGAKPVRATCANTPKKGAKKHGKKAKGHATKHRVARAATGRRAKKKHAKKARPVCGATTAVRLLGTVQKKHLAPGVHYFTINITRAMRKQLLPYAHNGVVKVKVMTWIIVGTGSKARTQVRVRPVTIRLVAKKKRATCGAAPHKKQPKAHAKKGKGHAAKHRAVRKATAKHSKKKHGKTARPGCGGGSAHHAKPHAKKKHAKKA